MSLSCHACAQCSSRHTCTASDYPRSSRVYCSGYRSLPVLLRQPRDVAPRPARLILRGEEPSRCGDPVGYHWERRGSTPLSFAGDGRDLWCRCVSYSSELLLNLSLHTG